MAVIAFSTRGFIYNIATLNFATVVPSDLQLEQKSTTWNLPRCSIPLNTPLWSHFDALVDENADMANRVGHLLAPQNNSHGENQTKEEVETFVDNNNNNNHKHQSIPHRLIFTHKDNLFDCSESASNTTTSPRIHTLAENAKATVRAYQQIWPDLQIVFLSDDDCIDALNLTVPELIPFFNDPALEGKYKADVCRAAYLVLHGGYYFDVDILVINPYVAPENATLVTVIAEGINKEFFFQAFLAADSGNAIVLRSLQLMLDNLRNEKASHHLLGPVSLKDAWKEVANMTDASTAINGENGVHFLLECFLPDPNRIPSSKCNNLLDAVLPKEIASEFLQRTPAGYGLNCRDLNWNICNYVVLDDSSIGGHQLYFYSRIVGTEYCGKVCS